eukprot:3802786-Heterocapsa_arctica.AAC.1
MKVGRVIRRPGGKAPHRPPRRSSMIEIVSATGKGQRSPKTWACHCGLAGSFDNPMSRQTCQ